MLKTKQRNSKLQQFDSDPYEPQSDSRLLSDYDPILFQEYCE